MKDDHKIIRQVYAAKEDMAEADADVYKRQYILCRPCGKAEDWENAKKIKGGSSICVKRSSKKY